MANLFFTPQFLPTRFQHPITGVNLSGGKIKAFLQGTTTNTNLFSDANGTPVGNELDINTAGLPEKDSAFVSIHVQFGVAYKIIVEDDANPANEIYTYEFDFGLNASHINLSSGSNLEDTINAQTRIQWTEDTGGSRNLADADEYKWTSFTNTAAKTITVVGGTLSKANGEYYIHNPQVNTTVITIAASGGATFDNPASVNLTILPGHTAVIKQQGSDNTKFHLVGCFPTP